MRNKSDIDGKMFPYEIPESLIFRPQDGSIQNAQKIDYLGKSKIIAGSVKEDNFIGFSGHQKKV